MADKLLLNTRDQLRVKRYPLRARANLTRRHGRSIPLARGERHARVPHPRGRDDALGEALCRRAESSEL
jgi:hypothetical protein